MLYFKRQPIIFLIAGRARSGKSTVGEIIKRYYRSLNKKVIVSQYTKYLKMYIENITGEIIDDNNKPRDLLQNLSRELIKKELKKDNFFIDRQLEDLEIYSYFADVIIVTDVRFKKEIDVVKEKFNNVISIGVIREEYESDLTIEQQKDITEISLDNYNGYDYKIINNKNNDLEYKVLDILNKITKEGI